jgi:hypothetical protein
MVLEACATPDVVCVRRSVLICELPHTGPGVSNFEGGEEKVDAAADPPPPIGCEQALPDKARVTAGACVHRRF